MISRIYNSWYLYYGIFSSQAQQLGIMNSNSNTSGMASNTVPYVLASSRINFNEFDEIANRLHSIAQRERRLLHEFTESIETIINRVSSNSSGSLPARTNTNQILCTVCLEKQRDCVLEPCMHVCCCISCLQLITDNKCPVCRTPIDFYMKLYICWMPGRITK